MGMDVYAESGDYFRNNVWWWRPLANYVIKVAPEIAAKCERWHTNDGSGLNGPDAKALAEILQEEIKSGRTSQYQIEYEAWQDGLANETCDLCKGTGIRTDKVGMDMRQPQRVIPADAENHPRAGQTGWCNGCDGKGYVRPYACHYPFSTENVQQFAFFLRDSGGFKIW